MVILFIRTDKQVFIEKATAGIPRCGFAYSVPNRFKFQLETHAHPGCKALEGTQRRVAAASFQLGNVSLIDPGLLGKLLLRQVAVFS